MKEGSHRFLARRDLLTGLGVDIVTIGFGAGAGLVRSGDAVGIV